LHERRGKKQHKKDPNAREGKWGVGENFLTKSTAEGGRLPSEKRSGGGGREGIKPKRKNAGRHKKLPICDGRSATEQELPGIPKR